MISDDFLKLYSLSYTSFASTGMGVGIGFRNTSTYHIRRASDKVGQYYVAYGYIPKISFKKVVLSYFTDCPQLQEKVENGEFKKDDFVKVVEFYNQNCAPKN